jgi:ABC-type transport system substrate-binding protein
MNMKRISVVWSLFLILALALLAGCAGSSGSNTSAALSSDNINLIFVVSPDLAYQTPGDIKPDTANLTNQGLTALAPHGHVSEKECAGDKQCKRYLRTGTDDAFADRK